MRILTSLATVACLLAAAQSASAQHTDGAFRLSLDGNLFEMVFGTYDAEVPADPDLGTEAETDQRRGDGELVDVLLSGISAGGYGVATFAPSLYRFIFPKRAKLFVLNDSGPSISNPFQEDVDQDGDLDIVTANFDDIHGRRFEAPYRVYLNNDKGEFSDGTRFVFPEGVTGNGLDIEAGDIDRDGKKELYLCSRGGPDRLLIRLK